MDETRRFRHRAEYVKYSQKLRTCMTKEERKLWYECLKSLPIRFYRQKVIENFIVDFYCPSKKLIIELDGSQHYEEEGRLQDEARDKRLNELGFTVVRYSNRDIWQNFASVCEDIYNRIGG